MIQDIKIKNFLSFKNEVVFSFEATKDTTLEDSLIVEVAPGVRLLRFAMIMGANGSGKSNLLRCVDFIRTFWHRKPQDIDSSTNALPFLLDEDSAAKPCEIEIRFWINGVKYWYILKLDNKVVYEEKLFYYKSVQPTNVFARVLVDGISQITFNPAVEKISDAVLNKLQVECLNNMSIFMARKTVNANFPVFDDVLKWADSSIAPIIDPEMNLFDYAKESIHENKDVHDYMVEYLKRADFNICELKTSETKRPIPQAVVNFLMTNDSTPADIKEHLHEENNMPDIEMQFVHKIKTKDGYKEMILGQELQSYGTLRTMGIEIAIYEALCDNALLNVDEFETSMHPYLLEYTIRRFLSETSESQLLITTHYDPLLNSIDELIRKDCVWFTEKEDDGASCLYSLVEFNGLNKMSSIQNNYRKGKFGALPNVNLNTTDTNNDEETKSEI